MCVHQCLCMCMRVTSNKRGIHKITTYTNQSKRHDRIIFGVLRSHHSARCIRFSLSLNVSGWYKFMHFILTTKGQWTLNMINFNFGNVSSEISHSYEWHLLHSLHGAHTPYKHNTRTRIQRQIINAEIINGNSHHGECGLKQGIIVYCVLWN